MHALPESCPLPLGCCLCSFVVWDGSGSCLRSVATTGRLVPHSAQQESRAKNPGTSSFSLTATQSHDHGCCVHDSLLSPNHLHPPYLHFFVSGVLMGLGSCCVQPPDGGNAMGRFPWSTCAILTVGGSRTRPLVVFLVLVASLLLSPAVGQTMPQSALITMRFDASALPAGTVNTWTDVSVRCCCCQHPPGPGPPYFSCTFTITGPAVCDWHCDVSPLPAAPSLLPTRPLPLAEHWPGCNGQWRCRDRQHALQPFIHSGGPALPGHVKLCETLTRPSVSPTTEALCEWTLLLAPPLFACTLCGRAGASVGAPAAAGRRGLATRVCARGGG